VVDDAEGSVWRHGKQNHHPEPEVAAVTAKEMRLTSDPVKDAVEEHWIETPDASSSMCRSSASQLSSAQHGTPRGSEHVRGLAWNTPAAQYAWTSASTSTGSMPARKPVTAMLKAVAFRCSSYCYCLSPSPGPDRRTGGDTIPDDRVPTEETRRDPTFALAESKAISAAGRTGLVPRRPPP
jgi:hypothetical protein